jgi:hypothetical protein
MLLLLLLQKWSVGGTISLSTAAAWPILQPFVCLRQSSMEFGGLSIDLWKWLYDGVQFLFRKRDADCSVDCYRRFRTCWVRIGTHAQYVIFVQIIYSFYLFFEGDD